MDRRLTLGVAALALVLTGCGGGRASGDDVASSPVPVHPTTSVEMLDPPTGWNQIEGEGFTLSAPDDFEAGSEIVDTGEPMLTLDKPSQYDVPMERVGVIRDVNPGSSAEEQSEALEMFDSAPDGDDTEVTRVEMPAPRGQSAFLVTSPGYLHPTGTDPVEATFWQLVHQVSDDLILNVVAFAPTAEFESSDVRTILRTFVPEDPD